MSHMARKRAPRTIARQADSMGRRTGKQARSEDFRLGELRGSKVDSGGAYGGIVGKSKESCFLRKQPGSCFLPNATGEKLLSTCFCPQAPAYTTYDIRK